MLCFINNRNYLTWPREMTRILRSQGHEVVIIDNDSSYPPLLEWYTTNPCEVMMLDSNLGHTAPWDIFGRSLIGTKYMVSDPVLDISGLLPDWADMMTEVIKLGYPKVGLTLSDYRIPPTNPAWTEDRFCDYPDGYNPESRGPILGWYNSVAIHNRPTDTTFAVCSKHEYRIDGVRIGAPYMAKHLPWHIVPKLTHDDRYDEIEMNPEIRYYFDHADKSSMTKPRLIRAGMIERRAK